MIYDFVNSIFSLLTGMSFESFFNTMSNSLGFLIPARMIIMLIFSTTFICFLFRIIYKFKCALFGKKKRKKER